MHDPGAFDVHAGEGICHELRRRRIEGADQRIARRRRIGERPEEIEHGAYSERTTHWRQRFHRGVKIRREQESEARGFEATYRGAFIERHLESQLFDEVGAAAAAGHGAVAMLDHGQAAGCREQRGAGGQVQAPRRVAASTHDIDGIKSGGQCGLAGQVPHRTREASNLGSRHALGTQCRQERAGHRGGEIGLGQGTEQFGRLRLGEVMSLEKMFESDALAGHLPRLPLHGTVALRATLPFRASPSVRVSSCFERFAGFKKFPMRRGPSGVSTLSGWNCTPSTARDRCRTPMISPSAVRAVISKLEGMLAGSAIKEW